MVCTFKNPLIHKIVSLIFWSVCTCEEKKFRRVFIVCWEGYVKYGKVKGQLGINAVDFFKSHFSAGLCKFFITCTAFQDPRLW